MKTSIIIPAYNAEKTIERALNSALHQDFKDFEVIVINDGSTDDTLKILESYGNRIILINQKNRGAVKAANVGFKLARGKYVVKLDADDWFEKGLLRESCGVLDKREDIDFVYSDYYEIKQGKRFLVSTKNNLFNTIAIGVVFRKSQFGRMGYYSENTKFAEYDLLLRTLEEWKGYHITEPLFTYFRHEKSLTAKKEFLEQAFNELKKAHPDKIEQIKSIRKY